MENRLQYWGKVCLETRLQGFSGYLVDKEGQVGRRLVILVELRWEAGSCLEGNLCSVSDVVEETVALHSLSCHSKSFAREKNRKNNL